MPEETRPAPVAPAPAPTPTPENVAKTPDLAPVPAPIPAPKAEPLPEPIRPVPAPTPAPAPKPAPAAKPAPEPKAPASGPSWSDRLGDPLWLGGIAAALVGLGAIAFVVRRRRALPNDLDVTAIAEEMASIDVSTRIPSGGFAMSDEVTETIPIPAAVEDESSFAGLLDEPDAPARRETPASAPAFSARPAPGPSPAPRAPIPTPAPAARPAPSSHATDSLFEDAGGLTSDSDASGGDAPMDQEMDLPLDRRGPPAPPARMGGSAAPSAASPDVARMLQEFERRIATLEARLDEANEAREKLERQVAAQSEELRVQRAAIARTQRALRTMTRGDEDKATEPALRDGDQTKTRITPTP
jgi:hypothetical protein